MVRIGYDSDTQRYQFRDSDGSIYEGSVYGGDLKLVSRPKAANASKAGTQSSGPYATRVTAC